MRGGRSSGVPAAAEQWTPPGCKAWRASTVWRRASASPAPSRTCGRPTSLSATSPWPTRRRRP
eukprot:3440410-Lingulodinium_polyedra.AAC.1